MLPLRLCASVNPPRGQALPSRPPLALLACAVCPHAPVRLSRPHRSSMALEFRPSSETFDGSNAWLPSNFLLATPKNLGHCAKPSSHPRGTLRLRTPRSLFLAPLGSTHIKPFRHDSLRVPCYECGLTFHSHQALTIHLIHAHATNSGVADALHGACCPCCLKQDQITHARPPSPQPAVPPFEQITPCPRTSSVSRKSGTRRAGHETPCMALCHRGRKDRATREGSVAFRTDVFRSFSVLPSFFLFAILSLSVGQRFDFSTHFRVPFLHAH